MSKNFYMPALPAPEKLTLDRFIQTSTPLAILPDLERGIMVRVEDISQRLQAYEAKDDPIEHMAGLLCADEDFLGVILALLNLSQEKFLRILTAARFAREDYGNEWTISTIQNKLRSDAEFARDIAYIFIEGRNNDFLASTIAPFYLDQLSLPYNWKQITQDPVLIRGIVRKKLAGEYIDKKGDAIENIIRVQLDSIKETYGIPFTKGQYHLLGKEIDHAIPSLENPDICVMTSYMETTSSAQTTRANEQSEMYMTIRSYNVRHNARKILVNIIDGAGWLARRSDLRKMYNACDYILNLQTLNLLESIVLSHVDVPHFQSLQRRRNKKRLLAQFVSA